MKPAPVPLGVFRVNRVVELVADLGRLRTTSALEPVQVPEENKKRLKTSTCPIGPPQVSPAPEPFRPTRRRDRARVVHRSKATVPPLLSKKSRPRTPSWLLAFQVDTKSTRVAIKGRRSPKALPGSPTLAKFAGFCPREFEPHRRRQC